MTPEYNKEKLKSLLEDFYAVTRIKTVLLDNKFKVIAAVPYGESSFCSALSKVKETRERCNKCNLDAYERCRGKKEPEIYRCHAGLIEVVSAIRIKDVIVGYIMFGQILSEGDKIEGVVNYAKGYIGDKASEYVADFVPRSEAEIRSSVKIMETCVCYMLMNKLIDNKQDSIVFELNQYIEENPTADLSANGICKHFNISRNTLYRISEIYFGMPIATYVREKRLKYAESLLKEGVKVTKAAELAGFYDYGYFGKIFKRHIGQTPMQIKKSSML